VKRKDPIAEMKERNVVGRPTVYEPDGTHNRKENLAKALEELRGAIGEEWVSDDIAITVGYSRDQSFSPASYPDLVALPKTTEDVQAIYRVANKYLIDIIPYGTGINLFGATLPPYGGILCDLRRMDDIYEIDEEALFARIGPGVNFLQLQVAAQRRGMRLTNPSTSATAGVVSNMLFCNINTMASKYGFGIDNVIDTTVVLPDATVMLTGPAAFGMQKANTSGPGPDLATLLRYGLGTLGICTEMTVRLYPEPEHLYQLYPAIEKDELGPIIKALYAIAATGLPLELAHLQNTFFGIFIGDDNREAEKLVGMMPRNNIIAIFGGSTEAEALAKAEVCRALVSEADPDFDFIEPEALDMLIGEKVHLDRWLKYFRETVRVQRVKGTFFVGALIDHLEEFELVEKEMRAATSREVGTTDGVFRPDDASAYLQPYHMGRACYLEFDLYTNRSDKDDLLRILPAYLRASGVGFKNGSMFAAGPACFIWGLADEVLSMVKPYYGVYLRTLDSLKRNIDPNNISARRFEYDTGRRKRLFHM
jgi:hypothetical protein